MSGSAGIACFLRSEGWPAAIGYHTKCRSPFRGLSMHLAFDHRLTDPTEAAVRAALKKACSAANGRRKTGVLTLTASGPKTLARRVVAEPGGIYSASGTHSVADTARLTLAWWTAPGGRKLV